ncbi:beta-1,6-N-acetylglucosaminyltransferase [Lactobacillus amylovorus]|uniref:beta-1,6-N-acetylglucosaminyltransferase n=1 Tax=Lactobacillus amylovorus TaxID=1604 RepID=UPI0022E66306|nr:beta-1,6-N-acetylglucosaminyltransferase [Lactobacillus amylovorus]
MQAIIITAYKNKNYLQKLISFFDKKYRVFVHIDKKSDISINDMNVNENVTIIKKYNIKWGGLNHLLAILELLRIASEQPDINYYHIISGQDIPVKSLSEFSIFENEEKIFMQCENIKNKDFNFKKRYRNGVLFSNGDFRKIIEKIMNKLYSFTHKPRYYISKYKEHDIYIGLVWCYFPQGVAKYVLKYCNVHNFPRGWQHIKIPEEFFFQTIIANSKFKNKIVSNNLRYMD